MSKIALIECVKMPKIALIEWYIFQSKYQLSKEGMKVFFGK
jgi:hypothetical protein